MTHRPHPLARVVLAASVLALALVGAPLAAGAQEGATPPTLAQVLRGEVAGLAAEATTVPSDGGDMGVVVEVTNEGDDPVAVAVPFGTLLVTEEEADQTLAVTPPPTDQVVEVAASGGTPTIEVGPGRSSHQLPAYCTEMVDGYPLEQVSLTPIEDAHPALAETLRTATAAEADHGTTQDAVWWLTDQPAVPVADDLDGLLQVDTDAFAAAPHRVTPDTGYVPMWMRDEAAGGGSQATPYDDEEAAAIRDESFDGATPFGDRGDGAVGTGIAIWAVLVGLVVVTSVVVATRAGRGSSPATAPVLARTTPGWYPDPWGAGGHRYWDGQRWTTRTMDRR